VSDLSGSDRTFVFWLLVGQLRSSQSRLQAIRVNQSSDLRCSSVPTANSLQSLPSAFSFRSPALVCYGKPVGLNPSLSCRRKLGQIPAERREKLVSCRNRLSPQNGHAEKLTSRNALSGKEGDDATRKTELAEVGGDGLDHWAFGDQPGLPSLRVRWMRWMRRKLRRWKRLRGPQRPKVIDSAGSRNHSQAAHAGGIRFAQA
jgi:hypothetical protein